MLYAVIIGFHEVFKKQARNKSHSSSILVIFTTVAFLLSLLWIPTGITIPLKYVLILALKGLIISFSWFIIIKILKEVDISLVTTLKLTSVIMTYIIGFTVFKESINPTQAIGIILVLTGVTLIQLVNKKEKGKTKLFYIFIILIAAVNASLSEIIDRYTTIHLTNFQVQFWFLLFACIFSWIFFIFECIRKKEFLIKAHDLKNFWVYLIGIFLFFGDFFLFLAYTTPGSQMVIITILSKLKILIAVFAGIIVFKEKNILKKILLTIMVVTGVLLIALF